MLKTAVEVFDEKLSRPDLKVFFCANRYIQGANVLEDLGRLLHMISGDSIGLIAPGDLPEAVLDTVTTSLDSASIGTHRVLFGGQCSYEEIERHVATLRDSGMGALIAVGGGKVIDAAKCVAKRLNVPLVVCPTLASTDAPCSAAAVIYTEDGSFCDVEFLHDNPAMVVVDTAVIIGAPIRFLLAGMADALATGYEARTCLENPDARSMVGGRISLAAATIAETCTRTVLEHGYAAIAAAKKGQIDESFERIVEANTLLSGTGFESGGLAAAHAVAQALTLVPSIEHGFLHGEMVAVGTMLHLMLEQQDEEFERVDEFLKEIGLPRSLSMLGIEVEDGNETFEMVIAAACEMPFMKNEPFTVDADRLKQAALAVEHKVGRVPVPG